MFETLGTKMIFALLGGDREEVRHLHTSELPLDPGVQLVVEFTADLIGCDEVPEIGMFFVNDLFDPSGNRAERGGFRRDAALGAALRGGIRISPHGSPARTGAGLPEKSVFDEIRRTGLRFASPNVDLGSAEFAAAIAGFDIQPKGSQVVSVSDNDDFFHPWGLERL